MAHLAVTAGHTELSQLGTLGCHCSRLPLLCPGAALGWRGSLSQDQECELRTRRAGLSTPGMGVGTGRCQGVSGPLLQGCCVCWQELKIKNLLVKGGSVSIEEQIFWNWNTSHRAVEDESQLPAGQAQHQALLPRGNNHRVSVPPGIRGARGPEFKIIWTNWLQNNHLE